MGVAKNMDLIKNWRPFGAFLVVLGPDGVGKTTFIAGLRMQLTILQDKDIDNIQLLHFRPHLIPNINKLLTGKVEIIGDFNNPHSAPPAGKFSSLLRISYYSLDYFLGYWLKLRQNMIQGRTIIFDRYFYDFIVDPRRSRLSLPTWAPQLFIWMIPKPDLVFVLDAPPAEIRRRKQELPIEEIERQIGAYRKLAADAPTRFFRIDASQPPEAMVDAALQVLRTELS